jgi:hypothetical protein
MDVFTLGTGAKDSPRFEAGREFHPGRADPDRVGDLRRGDNKTARARRPDVARSDG